MQINGATALVTGANRGLGRHIAEALRDRGAHVFAGARDPEQVTFPGVTPVQLDVTDPASIEAAFASTGPVSILVNNAGSSTGASLLTGDLEDLHTEFDTHVFGSLAVTRTYAPAMADLLDSSVLNVLSVLSWLAIPSVGGYCAAKAAAWSMTNSLRQELHAQGTTVTGLHVAYMDTDMTRGLDVPKSNPADVARAAVDAIERGDQEVIADDTTATIQRSLAGGVAALYPALATSG